MKTIKLNLPTLVLLIIEAAVGVLLLVNPIGFTSVIIRAIGIGLVVLGIVCCINYFRTQAQEAAASGMLFIGIILALLGAFLITRTQWLITTFTVILAVYAIMILLLGVLKLQWTVDLVRMKREKWGMAGISALIAIIFAVLILWNPFKSTEILWKLAGAGLVAQSVFDIIVLIFCPRVVAKDVRPREKKSDKNEKSEEAEE